MSNTTGEIKPISAVRFEDELQGDRGMRIRKFMQRRAQKGEFDSSRASILKLIDIGLDSDEKALNSQQV
jgi:hypothetical protein